MSARALRTFGSAGGALVSVLVAVACAKPPPPPTPAPTPEPLAPVAEPSPPEPAPAVDAPIQECGQDPAKESPIVDGKLGDGERIVRLINDSGSTIQARVLDASMQPALAGTLNIPAGTVGEFHLPEGEYMVRYRHGDTCDVRRGGKLVLTGPRAGVEISIKPRFQEGTRSRMKKVPEPL